jgi:tetratricopeptide (TPR) repeat protein
MEKATQLDPLALPINEHLGEVYMLAGRYQDAIKQYERTLDLDPTFRSAIEGKGWAYYLAGDIEKSLECFQKHHELVGHPLKGITGMGFVYAKSGHIDKAKEIIKKLQERAAQEPHTVISSDMAVVYNGLENYDKVYEYLDDAFTKKMSVFFVMSFPIFDAFRKTEQFRKLMQKHKIALEQESP